MKRIIIVLFVSAVLISIPVSNVVSADEDEVKMDVCHYPKKKTIGRVIVVSERAATRHSAMHGDLYWPLFRMLPVRMNRCKVAPRLWVCRNGEWRDLPKANAIIAAAREGNCFADRSDLPLTRFDGCECPPD